MSCNFLVFFGHDVIIIIGWSLPKYLATFRSKLGCIVTIAMVTLEFPTNRNHTLYFALLYFTSMRMIELF